MFISKRVSPEGMWRLSHDSRHGHWEPNNEIVLKKIDDGVMSYGSSYENGKNL